MKKFILRRTEDVSGISGTGVIAEGCVFSDGIAVLNWMTMEGSTGVYKSIEQLERIHGHEGRTVVEYVD